jgi:hypothetical protein
MQALVFGMGRVRHVAVALEHDADSSRMGVARGFFFFSMAWKVPNGWTLAMRRTRAEERQTMGVWALPAPAMPARR